MDLQTPRFLLRAGVNHTRFISPAASQIPALPVSKTDSLLLSLILELLGIDLGKIANRDQFIRAACAFNYIWQCMDTVIDDKFFTTASITEDDLDDTLVFHNQAQKFTTATQGWRLLHRIIPNQFFSIAPHIHAYRSALLRVANDPQYHQGAILSFETALQVKTETTGHLGETASEIVQALLGIEDHTITRMFGMAALAMQFGDDLLDWRTDWIGYLAKTCGSQIQVRPIENLLLATLLENPEEWRLCEAVLKRTDKSGYSWARELAPKTFDSYSKRFQRVVAQIPPHPKRPLLVDVLDGIFFKMLPRI